MQERLAADEVPGAVDRVSVSQRLLLVYELQAACVFTCRLGIGDLVTGANHDANLFHTGPQRLFDHDRKDGFLGAVPVDQGLQGQGPLLTGGRSDDGFCDLHTIASMLRIGRTALRPLCHNKGRIAKGWPASFDRLVCYMPYQQCTGGTLGVS